MILQGEMFYIEMDEYQIYCNGTTKWFYNQGTDETTQTPHDTSSANILDNPASFFRVSIPITISPERPGKSGFLPVKKHGSSRSSRIQSKLLLPIWC